MNYPNLGPGVGKQKSGKGPATKKKMRQLQDKNLQEKKDKKSLTKYEDLE